MGSGHTNLERRPAKRRPNKRIHVLCEGEVTEPEYLNAFFRSLEARTAVLGVVRGGIGVPKTVVTECVALKHEVEYEARKTGFKGLDDVWAVFDVDEHDFTDALPLAKENGIKCAISNPCIELWGLLHVRAQDRLYSRHEAQRALSEVMPGYHHKKNPIFDWSWCQTRVIDATQNAFRGRLRREQEGSIFPHDVPSSNFERLLACFDPRILTLSPDESWAEWPRAT